MRCWMRSGATRAHYQKFRRLLEEIPPDDFSQRRQSVDLSFLRQGITFNVYGDEKGAEKIFPFDLIPRIIPAQRMGVPGTRADPAHHGAQPVFARHLPRPEDPQGRRDSALSTFFGETFSPRVCQLQSPAGHLHSCLRHGLDSRREGGMDGAGRQRAVPIGCELSAGKPAGHEAEFPGDVRVHRGAAGGALSAGIAEDAAIHRARRGGGPGHCPADAGRAQLGLL